MASETRIYKELTEVQMTAHVQCTPLPIKGCMKFHIIVFKPDGNILSKEDICDCANCLIGDLHNCLYDDNGNFKDDEDADQGDKDMEQKKDDKDDEDDFGGYHEGEEDDDDDNDDEQDDVQASMYF